MSHQAQALVQSCIDFRFRTAINDFLEKELGLSQVDTKTDGGGVKKIVEEGPIRDWIFANYDISFDLHDVNRLVLINHQDCGAYGGSKSFPDEAAELAHHESELNKAVAIINSKYPDMEVSAYIALLGADNAVKFKQVI